MTRWIRHTLAGLALVAAAAAGAQDMVVRTAPKDVRPAMIAISATPPEITVDGKPERLSPGSRIRDRDNRIVMSASLAGQTLYTVYRRDAIGQVHEVWLLNAEEFTKLGGSSADLGNPEGYKRFQELLELIWAARWLLMR